MPSSIASRGSRFGRFARTGQTTNSTSSSYPGAILPPQPPSPSPDTSSLPLGVDPEHDLSSQVQRKIRVIRVPSSSSSRSSSSFSSAPPSSCSSSRPAPLRSASFSSSPSSSSSSIPAPSVPTACSYNPFPRSSSTLASRFTSRSTFTRSSSEALPTVAEIPADPADTQSFVSEPSSWHSNRLYYDTLRSEGEFDPFYAPCAYGSSFFDSSSSSRCSPVPVVARSRAPALIPVPNTFVASSDIESCDSATRSSAPYPPRAQPYLCPYHAAHPLLSSLSSSSSTSATSSSSLEADGVPLDDVSASEEYTEQSDPMIFDSNLLNDPFFDKDGPPLSPWPIPDNVPEHFPGTLFLYYVLHHLPDKVQPEYVESRPQKKEFVPKDGRWFPFNHRRARDEPSPCPERPAPEVLKRTYPQRAFRLAGKIPRVQGPIMSPRPPKRRPARFQSREHNQMVDEALKVYWARKAAEKQSEFPPTVPPVMKDVAVQTTSSQMKETAIQTVSSQTKEMAIQTTPLRQTDAATQTESSPPPASPSSSSSRGLIGRCWDWIKSWF